MILPVDPFAPQGAAAKRGGRKRRSLAALGAVMPSRALPKGTLQVSPEEIRANPILNRTRRDD